MESKDVFIYLCCYTVKEHPTFPNKNFIFPFCVLTIGSSLVLPAPAHFNTFLAILFSKSVKFLFLPPPPPPPGPRLYLLEFFLNFFFFILWLFEVLVLLCHCVF